MKKSIFFLIAATVLAGTPRAGAEEPKRNVPVTVTVTAQGENLEGQKLTVTQTDYSLGYGSLKLDAKGACSFTAYPGNHSITIERPGFLKLERSFSVTADTPLTLNYSLEEMTRKPFAIKHSLLHDAMTGRDDVTLGWNVEPPVFFDDFESYSPFALTFGDWTGIDGDEETTAPLMGTYPNRGGRQYCQIMNPLTVEPTWWYEYPVLRPYSGQQYAGFIRTSSGRVNDDWLISPVITPGTDNVLSFFAKAADRYQERFMVYVTEKTENPTAADFTLISEGNYDWVDYKQWVEKSYSLADYAGKPVRFAIRYVSDANHYGAFMLMVDDVYVGPKKVDTAAAAKSLRAMRSPANPNEKFEITLDGVKKATVDGYSYIFGQIVPGQHTATVKAIYRNSESEPAEYRFEVPSDCYADVVFNVTADSKLEPDGTLLSLMNRETSEQYDVKVADGKARIPSLPKGKYTLNVEKGAYEALSRDFEVAGDIELPVALKDNMEAPYNLTADRQPDGSILLRWNRDTGFSDSFEDYDDFATGSFGDWVSIDKDKSPVYPIALGSQDNIVSFPGSGSAANPLPLAPIVFNPLKTKPAMLPTDPAIAAPDGDKTIAFFSAQGRKNDKWLISPVIEIMKGYELKFLAKAYSSMYAENLDIYVAEESAPDDFSLLVQVEDLPSEGWGEYTVPIGEFEGKKIRVGFNYVSVDAFLMQLDSFRLQPADGAAPAKSYGNIDHFEISVDGKTEHTCTEPSFTLRIPEGRHVIGVCAVYKSGKSAVTEYTVDVSAVEEITLATEADAIYYDTLGNRVDISSAPAGIYIRTAGGRSTKFIKR